MRPLKGLLLVAFTLTIASIVLALPKDENDGQKMSVKMEHSVDGKTWKPRGSVSFRASTAFFASDDKRSQTSASLEQEKLYVRDIANLEELAAADGLYRVRIPVGPNSFAFASVPACQLLASGFSDSIAIHMTSSKPIALSYHVSSSKCARTAGVEQSQFQTQVHVKHGDEAPRPNLDPLNTGKPVSNPGAPVVQAATEPEPGFFQKYWHYMLPIPIMLLMAGICNGEEPKAKGGKKAAAAGAKK